MEKRIETIMTVLLVIRLFRCFYKLPNYSLYSDQALYTANAETVLISGIRVY